MDGVDNSGTDNSEDNSGTDGTDPISLHQVEVKPQLNERRKIEGTEDNPNCCPTQKNTAGDTWNLALSQRMCSLARPRFPFSTSETMLSVPNTSTRSFWRSP